MRLFLAAIISLCFLSSDMHAQTRGKKPASLKDAKDNFSKENYKAALDEYLGLLKNDPRNLLYHQRIGICYLNINGDTTRAVPRKEADRKQTIG
jgi:hypothetical protein